MQDSRLPGRRAHDGRLGYTYDAFCYHPQIPELIEALPGLPEVTVVVDHLCGPLGVGPYKDRRAEILGSWRGR